MGQEIVYCFWCSGRILGADFEKGTAVLIGNHACCAECLPKVMASLPVNQRETLLAELSKAAGLRPLGRNTPRGGTEISASRTPRGGTPVSASPANSKPPMLLFAVGGGIAIVVVLLLLLRSGGPPERTEARNEPPPPKAVGSDRDKTARDAVQKARDAARSGIDIDLQVRLWEEAVARSERTPSYDEATQERSTILLRRKDVYAQELGRLIDSVDGILRDDEFKKALDALASARKRHELAEWTARIDGKIGEVKDLEAAAAPYRPGPDGLVVVEAERFYRKTDVGEHAWTLVAAPAGFSGTGAMAALPNKGGGWPTNFVETSPRMGYRIQFPKAGKYYVWVRACAPAGTDDSLHAGLDGKESNANGITFGGNNRWNWSNRSMGAGAAYLDVPSEGLHRLTVWMREDGAILDRVILTLDPKFVPKDVGPPETSR